MLKARLTLPYRVNLSLYLTSGCHWTDNGAPSVNGRAQMFNLLANITQYSEIKSQVEAKWDIIAMLCLLLFFLTMVVLVFSIWRPYYVAQKVIALLIAFLLGYGASFFAVQKGLSPEFYKAACHEFYGRLGMSESGAAKACLRKNPIRLSRVQRIE